MNDVDDMEDGALLALCHEAADAVTRALGTVHDWRPSGERPGQYAIDLVADRAVLDVFEDTGIGVVSEESGTHRPGATLVAVVDPVDGSTNASRGIPWYATSVCILDGKGPRVSVVANLASGVRHHAVRGQGAWRGTTRLHSSSCETLSAAVVAIAGMPPGHLGWAQFRTLGAAALDLCAVADGTLDGFVVGVRASLSPWDYLGALLVCTEAGVSVGELNHKELVTTDTDVRRAVVAAAGDALLHELVTAYAAAQAAGGG